MVYFPYTGGLLFKPTVFGLCRLDGIHKQPGHVSEELVAWASAASRNKQGIFTSASLWRSQNLDDDDDASYC